VSVTSGLSTVFSASPSVMTASASRRLSLRPSPGVLISCRSSADVMAGWSSGRGRRGRGAFLRCGRARRGPGDNSSPRRTCSPRPIRWHRAASGTSSEGGRGTRLGRRQRGVSAMAPSCAGPVVVASGLATERSCGGSRTAWVLGKQPGIPGPADQLGPVADVELLVDVGPVGFYCSHRGVSGVTVPKWQETRLLTAIRSCQGRPTICGEGPDHGRARH